MTGRGASTIIATHVLFDRTETIKKLAAKYGLGPETTVPGSQMDYTGNDGLHYKAVVLPGGGYPVVLGDRNHYVKLPSPKSKLRNVPMELAESHAYRDAFTDAYFEDNVAREHLPDVPMFAATKMTWRENAAWKRARGHSSRPLDINFLSGRGRLTGVPGSFATLELKLRARRNDDLSRIANIIKKTRLRPSGLPWPEVPGTIEAWRGARADDEPAPEYVREMTVEIDGDAVIEVNGGGSGSAASLEAPGMSHLMVPVKGRVSVFFWRDPETGAWQHTQRAEGESELEWNERTRGGFLSLPHDSRGVGVARGTLAHKLFRRVAAGLHRGTQVTAPPRLFEMFVQLNDWPHGRTWVEISHLAFDLN